MTASLDALSAQLVKRLQPDSKEITLLSLLVVFWHNVLALAVEYEDFAIKTAQAYAKQEKCSSPWKSKAFANHLKNLHDARYGHHLNSINDVGFTNGFILMPFLMTMRLDAWFDMAMLEVNCSLQLMIRFEQTYIAEEKRRYASVKSFPENLAMDLLLRRVWHAMLSCYSMVYNNAFAFCVSSLVQGGCQVTWHNYAVREVFTIAGSLLLPTVLSPSTRVLSNNGGKFEETTWIMFSLFEKNTGQIRLVQCTLTQNNISCEIYLQKHLPFTVLPPYPLLDGEFVETVRSKEALAEHIVTNHVEPTIVKCAVLWCSNIERQSKRSVHRVDKLCEMIGIRRRMHDLLSCMLDANSLVLRLRLELSKSLCLAKESKKHTKVEYELFEQKLRKRVEEDSLLIIHIRNNSQSMFALLNAISQN